MSATADAPIVYLHPDGKDYVAADADGTWYRWPAASHGWQHRERSKPADAGWYELPPHLARLALRLSGVSS